MFKSMVVILIALVLIGAGWWYYSNGGTKDPVEGFQDAVKYQTKRAGQAVEQTIGSTVDDLKESIDNTGNTLKAEINDATLLATIKAKLITEKSLDGFKIQVEVDKGVVNLNGSVPTLEARSLAIKLARETDGVKGLHANLKLVRPDSPAAGDSK